MEFLLYNSFNVQGHLFRVYLCANLLYYEKTLCVIYFSKKLVKWCTGTLDALRKNRSITLNTLHDICDMINCSITDVVEFISDTKKET